MDTPVRRYQIDLHDDPVLPIAKRGKELLADPLLNKGTGFPDSERDALSLRGLVPPQVVSIDDQVARVMENYRRKDSDLERYIHLETLHDRNETLYYRVLSEHIRELTPVIYTPVVGQACRDFGHIYRRARGMYFAAAEMPYFHDMVNNWPEDEVDVIVVTDGSRILGLGDLGTNGMGIPIGKLSLYVLGAGIYPCKTLPVQLDVGTNNETLRNDPLYLGKRIPRLTDEHFYEVVEAFIQAVHQRWPGALIQFEDFSKNHAFPLLTRYREQILCFNDDIQGTGAVTLAGILSALRITGQSLADQRVLFMGAGSAARGIADMIVTGMKEDGGLSDQAARSRIWMLDSKGLVTRDRLTTLDEHKREYAHPHTPVDSLEHAVKALSPSILIGVSGQPGAFTEAVVRQMHKRTLRPIIFPLSNPTTKSECTAEHVYRWTDGQGLFASGSPFGSVELQGRTLHPGQCNNMYVFPGVGMGAVSCKARIITDGMFHAAARTLAGLVRDDTLAAGGLYPDLAEIREISAQIAEAVCQVAFDERLAGIRHPDDLSQHIRSGMFQPDYVPYRPL